jgi:hypothetical protein
MAVRDPAGISSVRSFRTTSSLRVGYANLFTVNNTYFVSREREREREKVRDMLEVDMPLQVEIRLPVRMSVDQRLPFDHLRGAISKEMVKMNRWYVTERGGTEKTSVAAARAFAKSGDN